VPVRPQRVAARPELLENPPPLMPLCFQTCFEPVPQRSPFPSSAIRSISPSFFMTALVLVLVLDGTGRGRALFSPGTSLSVCRPPPARSPGEGILAHPSRISGAGLPLLSFSLYSHVAMIIIFPALSSGPGDDFDSKMPFFFRDSFNSIPPKLRVAIRHVDNAFLMQHPPSRRFCFLQLSIELG